MSRRDREMGDSPPASLGTVPFFAGESHRTELLPLNGFTLVELLVVIAIIGVLAAILFPVFGAAKNSAKRAQCASNLRQLAAAVMMYADENNGRYVPAASDIFTGNLHRWHGARQDLYSPFVFTQSPLWSYMGRCERLKICPSVQSPPRSDPTVNFEPGCGGYGYNQVYVGGTYYKYGYSPRAARVASTVSDICRPSKTVMFTDAGMARGDSGSYVQEYSFCEPPYFIAPDRTRSNERSTPTIHFRHGGRALVAWCDGHVTCERMTFTTPGLNVYQGNNGAANTGWFGPDDNSLFDTE